MKKPMINKLPFLILSLMFLFIAAITSFSSDRGVLERVKEIKRDELRKASLPIPIPVNTITALVEYQGGTFLTETRKNNVKRFRCSGCHNDKQVMINNAARLAHADIQVVHGQKGNPLDCYTCHSKNERDFLNTSKQPKIDMDHVYDMCGECHFRQKKDWVGGAHGKRVDYWAGARVIKNCTSCHNPHSPRFKKRWPATYSIPLD